MKMTYEQRDRYLGYTNQQQRVWDAAFGAALAIADVNSRSIERFLVQTDAQAIEHAIEVADRAAAVVAL